MPELVALTRDDDWLVVMRAVDLLEKLAHEHAYWVEPYKRVFIGDLADSDKWEMHLQIVRALPLFIWTVSERRRAIDILLRDVEHPRVFVKAWALDSSLMCLARARPAAVKNFLAYTLTRLGGDRTAGIRLRSFSANVAGLVKAGYANSPIKGARS